MSDITKKLAEELAGDLANNYSLQEYITKTPSEKEKIILQSHFKNLIKATDYEFESLSYYETMRALK